MKLTSTLAIAGLLAGISLPVVAQDVTSAVSSAVDTTVSAAGGASVSADASVSTSAEASGNASANASTDNYGNLISALQADKGADLSTVTETTTITFVTVSSLSASGEAKALDNALEKNADANAKLKTDIAANSVLSAKLTDAGYTAEQVVAVVAGADGALTVYIDDRA